MEKQCKYCGAPLPTDASFCHFCEKSQIEKVPAVLPKPQKRKKALTVCFLLILMVGICWTFLSQDGQLSAENTEQPVQTVEAAVPQTETVRRFTSDEAELYYTAENGKRYYLRLNFSGDGEADERKSKTIPEDREKDGSFPSLLYISEVDSEEYLTEDFMQEFVEECYVETMNISGKNSLRTSEVIYDSVHLTNAARKTDLSIESKSAGDNIVRWTLKMKNGDVLILEQTVTLELMKVQKYHWEETPMNTLAELNAFIEQLADTTAENEVVEIYLPPVIYDGGLDLNLRPFRFYGSSTEEGQRTTFTAPSISRMHGVTKMEFFDIDFIGNGGTGISCEETVFLRNCRFEGWDIGVHVQTGGWSQSDDCIYKNNGIGLLFDCAEDGSFGPGYDNNVFEDNGIGIQIKAVPNRRTLSFDQNEFRGNGVNIDNVCGQSIEINEPIYH